MQLHRAVQTILLTDLDKCRFFSVNDHYDFKNSMDSSCLVTVISSLPEQRRMHAIASSCPDNFAERPWIKLYGYFPYTIDLKIPLVACLVTVICSLPQQRGCMQLQGAARADNFAQEPVWSNPDLLTDNFSHHKIQLLLWSEGTNNFRSIPHLSTFIVQTVQYTTHVLDAFGTICIWQRNVTILILNAQAMLLYYFAFGNRM